MSTNSIATAGSDIASPQVSVNPKIVHIVGDKKMGGVKSTLTGLVESELATEFDFTVLSIVGDQTLLKIWQSKPDVIVCHHPLRFKVLPHFMLLKLLNPQTKIVIHEHGYSEGYETWNVKAIARFHTMLRIFYAMADQVTAISQAQGQWMLQNRLVNAAKLAVITQCPPLEAFFSIPLKRPKTPLILVAYGRLCFHKGFDVLLKALKLIPECPVELRIAGEGVQELELKQLAQGLENVQFVGRVDDVPAFLQACHAVVIPSRWEPWGNVCLEAKAAGKPVIASDIDGLTEQMQDCGTLVPPDNVEELAQAIEELVSRSPSQIETLGKNGRAAVQGSGEKYLVEWRNLFLKVLSK